jgi:hypothetical protein
MTAETLGGDWPSERIGVNSSEKGHMLFVGATQMARVRWWGLLDAWRNVDSDSGPPAIDQLASELAMTTHHVGRLAHDVAEEHRRHIGELTARQKALDRQIAEARRDPFDPVALTN